MEHSVLSTGGLESREGVGLVLMNSDSMEVAGVVMELQSHGLDLGKLPSPSPKQHYHYPNSSSPATITASSPSSSSPSSAIRIVYSVGLRKSKNQLFATRSRCL